MVCLVPRLIQSKDTNKLLDNSSYHFRRLVGDLIGFSPKQVAECVGRLILLKASKHFVSLLYPAPPSVPALLEPC